MADVVTMTVAPAGDVVVVDLWTAAAPDFAGIRAVRVEPQRWWLIDGGPAVTAVTLRLQGDGVFVPIGGGLVRATLIGPGWRALLMLAAVFDAENPGFGPGAVAATIIHHVPVWIVPVTDDCAEVFFAASYATGLVAPWRAAIARGIT